MTESPLVIASTATPTETLENMGAIYKGRFNPTPKQKWFMVELPEEMHDAIIELANVPGRTSTSKWGYSKVTTHEFFEATNPDEIIATMRTLENGSQVVFIPELGQSYTLHKAPVHDFYPDSEKPATTAKGVINYAYKISCKIDGNVIVTKGHGALNCVKSFLSKATGDHEEAQMEEEADAEEESDE